jgi:hypothetical protein
MAQHPRSSRASRKKCREVVSPEVARLGRLLFDQQMWCFGRDIITPPENRLIQYGFQRIPCPDSPPLSTRYERTTANGVTEVLWGFGMLYGRDGSSILLKRHGFVPCLSTSPATNASNAWSPDRLGAWKPPQNEEDLRLATTLIAELCESLASYERWIADQEPTVHRHDVLAAWKAPVCTAQETTDRWLAMSAAIREGSHAI